VADISKIKLGSTTYDIKDQDARDRLTAVETTLASSLIFKGTVSSAAGITGLTNYKIGWTYKASAAFTISSVGTVENGDMIICISDYSSSYKASDWTVVQNNVETFTGATSSSAGTRGLVPAPTKNQTSNYLKSDGTWSGIDKLATARTISLDNGFSGSASFDGSSNVSIDVQENRYVIGTQTASTAAWTGVLSSVKALYDGLTINYWLPYTSPSSTNVTLELTLADGSTTGAINCYRNGTTRLTTHYPVNYLITLTYFSSLTISGTSYTGWWVTGDVNSTYSNASLGQGYATCSTAAATAAKVASLSSYSLATGGVVAVKFTYDVPASATLNVNNKGAKSIYY
jgi:hypothetical protein